MTSAQPYWRDASEFVLTAFSLDIPHPTGFPLYGMLSNLFTFFPFGEVVFRVNLFSSFLALLLAFLGFKIVDRLVPLSTLKLQVAVFLSILATLLGSSAFLRQSITAEVYLLYACGMFSISYCLLSYERTEDVRWLFTSAFVAGLSIAIHAASVLFVLLLVPLMFGARRKIVLRHFGVLAFVGILGSLLYLYLPLRGLTSPPLDTGSVDSVERFWRYISLARDRALRPEVLQHVVGLGSSSPIDFVGLFFRDLSRLVKEVGFVAAPLATCGLVLLLKRTPFAGVLVVLGAGSSLFFFSGWQADPWLPAIAWSACLVALLSCSLVERKFGFLWIAVLVAWNGYQLWTLSDPQSEIRRLRDFSLPEQSVRTKLEGLSFGAVFVVEPSWFIARYLQVVEGVRPDVLLVYNPSLFFPAYFRKTKLVFGDVLFESARNEETNPEAASFTGLKSLLQVALEAKHEVYFEPVTVLNGPLRKLLEITPSGIARFAPTPDLTTPVPRGLLDDISSLDDIHQRDLFLDTLSQTEASVGGVADLLLHQERYEQAVDLLSELCGKNAPYRCSRVSLNNLAVTFLRSGRNRECAQLLIPMLSKSSFQDPVLLANSKSCFARLTPEERTQIEDEFAELGFHSRLGGEK